MKQTTLTTWLLKLPLRFSIISLALILLLSFLYPLIGELFYSSDQTLPSTPLFIIIFIGIFVAMYLSIKKAPKFVMDNKSFITIHTAQTLLMFLLVSASTYILLSGQQNILIKLALMESQFSGTTPIFIVLLAITLFYILGIEIFNIYVKIRCMQHFNIPTWKIILSIPFGFSALWVPGYLSNIKSTKKPSQGIKSKWYTKLINWTTKTPLNTISMFVFITVLSSFFAGLNSILLTFSFALLFGIWVLQVGTKKFEKNITKTYSTVAIVINIILIIIFAFSYISSTKATQNLQINISDIETASTQGQ